MKNQIPQEVRLENKPCPLGCPPNDKLYLKGFDRIYNLPGVFSVVQCSTCQLLRTNPRPAKDSIGFYYPNDYSPYQSTRITEDSRIKSKFNQIKKIIAHDILRIYDKAIPRMKPGRMLEIGCASGSYLHFMASRGWMVEGIEFSKLSGNEALKLGYPVHLGTIETAPEPKHKYDLISAWMTLEHLHEPIISLQRLASWIKPEGWLVFSVPDVSVPWHKSVKDLAYDLHLPAHLYHFTPETISKILNVSGWEMKRVIHHKTLRAIMLTLSYLLEARYGKDYRLAKWLRNKHLFGPCWQLTLYPFSFLSGITKLSGRMTIWAQIK